jgi:hypothetical protein
MFDIRLKENFKLFLVGPSACGKSVFIQNLLQNISTVSKTNPTKIIYVYKVWQPLYEDMNLQGLVHLFIKEDENLAEKLKMETIGEISLIVFDDLINSKNLGDISNLFVVDGRHSNYSMIFTSQRMFVNNEYFRQISNNCDYFVVFKNPRNHSEIRTLAQQLTPLNLELLQIYAKATTEPYSYLFINLTQECDESIKFLSHLFDYDHYVKCYVRK